MKLGVLQGRLQPPVDGHIQEFPTKWFAEFKLLKDLDLHYLEWIVTKPSFSTNPIFERKIGPCVRCGPTKQHSLHHDPVTGRE